MSETSTTQTSGSEKITELTEEQKAAMPNYVRMGIEIGLATGPDVDMNKVRELTEAHREMCGVPKATNFLVYDSPMAAMRDIPSLTASTALYGQHDISWLIYYTFFQIECGVQGLEGIQYLRELAKLTGWMWMSSDTTVVTRRPKAIHLLEKSTWIDENARIPLRVLHNYNGLALEYADGEGVYACNGTRIPTDIARKFIECDADSLDVNEVLNITNTEIRTEILKKIGIEKAFDRLDKKLLDSGQLEVGGHYELYLIQFGDVSRTYLRGECPTNGEPFFEAVHPDCRTIRQASMWRRGGSVSIPYKAPKILT